MMGKRNVYAIAARERKAGPHSGKKKPDVFDDINEYTEEDLEELQERAEPPPFFDVGERVRVVNVYRYTGSEGRVVARIKDLDGSVSFDVVFDWDLAGIPANFSGKDLERV